MLGLESRSLINGCSRGRYIGGGGTFALSLYRLSFRPSLQAGDWDREKTQPERSPLPERSSAPLFSSDWPTNFDGFLPKWLECLESCSKSRPKSADAPPSTITHEELSTVFFSRGQ